MNEVEKMYSNAGIKKKPYCELNCSITKNNFECTSYCLHYEDEDLYYPPFTAEKQLELIKWLGKNKNGFNVFYDTSFNGKEKHYWCCADQYYEDFNYGYHEKEFSEALAGLINELPLTDAEKEQIKNILE